MKTDAPVEVGELTATVVQDHGKELRSFLLRRIRNREDVADLAQQVFLRLLEMNRAKEVRKPRAFLFGVAAHALADFRLQSEPEGTVVSLDNQDGDYSEQHGADEDPAIRLELARRVRRLLDELPPIQRAVFVLCKRDGMTYEEVSKKLGISVAMVNKHIVWAKAKLKTMDLER